MNWIKNAYVKLIDQTEWLQTVAVAFEGAWLHVAKDEESVETFPAEAVELVRWRQE